MFIKQLALFGTLLSILNLSYADTVTDQFLVSARIVGGCVLGSELNSNSPNLGNIDFGKMVDIPASIDVTSSLGAGSIVVTCTPGISVDIGLNYGLNGNNQTRYLSNGNQKIAYQLYQDASKTLIWGTPTDNLSKKISTFPSSPQILNIYARLFPISTMPTIGEYTDTVTVTLTY